MIKRPPKRDAFPDSQSEYYMKTSPAILRVDSGFDGIVHSRPDCPSVSYMNLSAAPGQRALLLAIAFGALGSAMADPVAPAATNAPRAVAAAPVRISPATRYRVTDLGPGDTGAIDPLGRIVGSVRVGDQRHVAVFNADAALSTLLGRGQPGDATGINRAGQIVGTVPMPSGNVAVVFGSRGLPPRVLAPKAVLHSSAMAINDRGEVVGMYTSAGAGQPHAYLFNLSNQNFLDLGTLGGTSSSAGAINASGQIVGSAATEFDATQHATLFGRNGEPNQDLGTLGGPSSIATAINDAGQVVGWSTTAKGVTHATLYNREGIQNIDLGTLGGIFSAARGINNQGVIVGLSGSPTGPPHACIYISGAIIDLNKQTEPAGGTVLAAATAINDAGQIVCAGQSPQGEGHVFLLTPISPGDNPSAAAHASAKEGPASGKTADDVYTVIDLGVGEGRGLNNRGQVVGSTTSGMGGLRAVLFTRNGEVTTDLRGFGDSFAEAINDSGVVVGTRREGAAQFYLDGSTSILLGWANGSGASSVNRGGQVVGHAGDRAVLYKLNGAGVTELGGLGGSRAEARAISDTGMIVGEAMTTGDRGLHATKFSGTGADNRDLGTLGGRNSFAMAVNQFGEIAGFAELANGQLHAAVYSGNGAANKDLGTLGGMQSFAFSISKTGVIVGASEIANAGTAASAVRHAFLYKNGQMIDLNTRVPRGTPLVLAEARVINDGGAILANSLPVQGRSHALLLFAKREATDLPAPK